MFTACFLYSLQFVPWPFEYMIGSKPYETHTVSVSGGSFYPYGLTLSQACVFAINKC